MSDKEVEDMQIEEEKEQLVFSMNLLIMVKSA